MMNGNKIPSTHSYQFLNLLWAICIIDAGFNFMAPLWAEYVLHLGATIKVAGTAIAIYSIGIAVFTLLVSLVVMRIGRRKILFCCSVFIMAIGFMLYLFVHHAWQLYLLQLFIAFAVSIQTPTFDSLYGERLSHRMRPLGWGAYTSASTFSMGVGAYLGAHITHYAGFKATFIVMTAIALVAFVLSIFSIPATDNQ